jgi:hypothetical protein
MPGPLDNNLKLRPVRFLYLGDSVKSANDIAIRLRYRYWRLLAAEHLYGVNNALSSSSTDLDVLGDSNVRLYASFSEDNPRITGNQLQTKITSGPINTHILLDFASRLGDHLPQFFEHTYDVREGEPLSVCQTFLQFDHEHSGIIFRSFGHG